MSYATLDDLTDRYGERLLIDLTDREDVASGAIDADAVSQALTQASAEIDGYLLNRYQLPLSQVPPTVVDLACILTIWRLHSYDPSEKIAADYKEAQKRLREIATGVFALSAAGLESPTTGGSGARTTDRPRPFTESSMRGFI